MRAITWPTSDSSPARTNTSRTTPLTPAGISTSALSPPITATVVSASTVSPTDTRTSRISTSTVDIPIFGTYTSVTGSFLLEHLAAGPDHMLAVGHQRQFQVHGVGNRRVGSRDAARADSHRELLSRGRYDLGGKAG